jgi:hypothetical protein
MSLAGPSEGAGAVFRGVSTNGRDVPGLVESPVRAIMEPSLIDRDGVAIARHRCGLRLALTKNQSVVWVPPSVRHCAMPPLHDARC